MNPGIAADLVTLIHFGFILFVVIGGLLVLRWPPVAWLHLPAVAWGIWIEATAGICPLTPLELSLRAQAGEAGYEGGFIEHYLLALIYPEGLTPAHQTLFAVLVLAINGAVYVALLRRRHRVPSPGGVLPPPRRP